MDIQALQNFRLPDGAYEAIASQSRQTRTIEPGVEIYSGHSKGVPYRFFIHQEYNQKSSKVAKVEIYKPEEMIEWMIDKDNKPSEKVRFLPSELLEIDFATDEVMGGLFAESYKRWKEGLSAPGTSIERWGVANDSQMATLKHRRIFTVEQFAAMPRGKVQAIFANVPEFLELFDRAIQFVNSQEGRFEVEEHAKEILSLRELTEKQQYQLKVLEKHLAELKEGKTPAVSLKKRGRPRKESTEVNESQNLESLG